MKLRKAVLLASISLVASPVFAQLTGDSKVEIKTTLVRMVDEGSKVSVAVGTLVKERRKDAPVVIETGTMLWTDKTGEIMDAALAEGIDPSVVVESEVRGGADIAVVHAEALKHGIAVQVILKSTMAAGVDPTKAVASAITAGIDRNQLRSAALTIGMEPGDVVAGLLSGGGDVTGVVKEMIELRPESANDILVAAFITRPSDRATLAEFLAKGENARNLPAAFAVSNLIGQPEDIEKQNQAGDQSGSGKQASGKPVPESGKDQGIGTAAKPSGAPLPILPPKLRPSGGSGGGELASPS